MCGGIMSKNVWAVLLPVVSFLVSCSDARLLKPREKITNIASVGSFCTQPPDTSTVFTKFLFVIDKSGSNSSGNGFSNGTDPDNRKRADNIEKFWIPRQTNPFIKWGYVVFNGDFGSKAYIGPNDGKAGFSGIPDDMQNAISRQRSEADTNGTPYKAALGMAKQAIRDDIKEHPEEDSNYLVFFMSDGYPTDYNGQGPPGPEAFADVQDLINIYPGKIRFSAAYYGPEDVGASEGMKKMAEVGQGKFVDLNQTDDFEIDDLLVGGASGETYVIKPGSFIVYNTNSSICFDNAMGLDSDGDGLCDKDEVTLGVPYAINNRFSFGDGYGDYIHYAAKLAKENLIACNDRTDQDNDLLTLCEESYMKNMAPTGTKLTSTDRVNPDTDSDGIGDGIEYFMLHQKSVGLDMFNLFRNFDTEFFNAGDQIRAHRNPLFPDDKIPAENYYDTKIDFTGFNSQGQSCYNFSQANLQVFKTSNLSSANALNDQHAHPTNGNVVMVSFIQTLQRDPSAPGVYVYSFQTLDANSKAGLTINDKIFKFYKVPVMP